MTTAHDLALLDCTLRDGGYNNAWDFHPALVARYLAALDRTGVRWVEMGYRAAAPEPGAGPWRAAPDALLADACAGLSLGVAVMVEAKRLLDAPAAGGLRALFRPRAESPVAMIRIAVAPGDAARALPLVDAARALGYLVAVNLMQASLLDPARVERLARALDPAAPDYLYLADSFGGLTPAGAAERVRAAREGTGARVGFHAHDNLGLALANSIAAAEAGAAIVDGSVRGMGRGAGNVRTEQALAWLEAAGRHDVSCTPLAALVEEDFARLHARWGWGASAPYALAALGGVHPTYVQHLVGDPRRGTAEVLDAVRRLAADPGRAAFDAGRLAAVLPRRGLRALG